MSLQTDWTILAITVAVHAFIITPTMTKRPRAFLSINFHTKKQVVCDERNKVYRSMYDTP